MHTNKHKRMSPMLEFSIVLGIAYFVLRIASLVQQEGSTLTVDHINYVSNNLFSLKEPIIINSNTVQITIFIALFSFMMIEWAVSSYHKNRQEETHGSAEWGEKGALKKKEDKDIAKNMIFTKNHKVSSNMRISKTNRNVLLVGRPGTGKSRKFYIPNILNATGSKFVTDPKGALLRACGFLLKRKGYTIKVLNMDDKSKSTHYNPFKYIRKISKKVYTPDDDFITEDVLREDDVMSLINIIFKNIKSDAIQTQTGDPFWEKAEMIFLQSIFYYILYCLPEEEKNFISVLKLIKYANPDEKGNSKLDELFAEWATKDPDNIGIKQYELFKTARGKMTSTIIMTAAARLAPFNIKEIADMTKDDEMELHRMGHSGKKGKVIWFIITKPNDSSFNWLANIFYTQAFIMLDQVANNDFNGTCPTPVDFYLEEWRQLGEIPLFKENLAYIREFNAGIVIGLQSLTQLSEVYKDAWEDILDCCDYFLFLGAASDTTLDYVSKLLGEKTWYKKSQSRSYGRNGSSSHSWDVVGRALAKPDEIYLLPENHAILFSRGQRPLYDQLYDVTKHHNYSYLFEPWEKERTKGNIYNLEKERIQEEKKNKDRKEFAKMGIDCDILDIATTPLSADELRKLKYEVVNEEVT